MHVKKVLSSTVFLLAYALFVVVRRPPADLTTVAAFSPTKATTMMQQRHMRGMFTDGTFTGPSSDAYYGNIQVQVTVQDGTVADVTFLDHPQDRRRSIQINDYAMPALRTEAIRAQAAPVDVVSGATYTSEAFNTSLASALAQARNT